MHRTSWIRTWPAVLLVATALAALQPGPTWAGAGGTAPVYSYADAIRETVFVVAPMDSDHDGRPDRIAVEVIRPRETDHGLRVPAIMEASPYFGWPGRDPITQPEWYAPYFVPRGYAYVEAAMQGTWRSEGCPTTGGPEDTTSAMAALNWLTGRARAFYADGREARATWSMGRVGMVGLSYDGTLADAVAAQGPPGLRTIVPIDAISSWYDYARDQGIPYDGAWGRRYPEYQADRVISDQARARCGSVLQALGDGAADTTGDYTPFWDERNYRDHAARLQASVLMVQGLADTKVKGREFAAWWQELASRDVPRKLWLDAGGHEDPVGIRPGVWQETVHRWMDHWLYGVRNGIMDEPMVDVQRPDGSWETHRDWPEPGTEQVRLSLAGGVLSSGSGAGSAPRAFVDDPTLREQAAVVDPQVANPNRLAWLSAPLPRAVRISGAPSVDVSLSADRTRTPLTALLVDYGPPAPQGGKRQPVPIVTRGAIEATHRDSLARERPLQPGRRYDINWQLHATDYVVPAGHRIGLVLVANDPDYISTDPAGATITVFSGSRVELPVVG